MTSFLSPKNNLLMLVDAHAVIYRAYYAFPKLTSPQGELVNAVFGFTRILLTAIRELRPTHVSVVYDHPQPTFRHQQFEAYKAHREEMPVDLRPQVELTKELVSVLGIPRFELAGYEADDLIGTLAAQAAKIDTGGEADRDVDSDVDSSPNHSGDRDQETNLKTMVVTGDKDLFQLITDSIHVWLPGRGRANDQEYDREGVLQKMGVYPEQVVDLKALMGDASDNIPGVKGIGPKTAAKLLAEFGSLESVLAAVDQLTAGQPVETTVLKGSVLTKLAAGRDQALLSQQLARIDQQAPIELELEECRVSGYDKQRAVRRFQELEFRSLVSILPNDEFETSVQQSLF